MATFGENAWHRICKHLPNKTEIKCFQRWLDFQKLHEISRKRQRLGDHTQIGEIRLSSTGVLNSPWSAEEDMVLKETVLKFGTQNWVIVSKHLPGRLGRQCRERWHNVLDPSIIRRAWTREEDEFILRMQRTIG